MDKYLEIKGRLEELADKEYELKMSAYMRNKFRFYGIPTPKRRSACRPIIRDDRKKGIFDQELLKKCWNDRHREFQYFVLDYLSDMQNTLSFDDIPEIEKFVRSKQWWDTIDSLDNIIGRIGLRDKRVGGLMLRWSEDADFWVRRVAIDHQLCYRDKTDTELLEKIIVNNFGSDEFFINKAIGWSLREYSKTNPEWVKEFIGRYSSEMSRLSLREASKYCDAVNYSSSVKERKKK